MAALAVGQAGIGIAQNEQRKKAVKQKNAVDAVNFERQKDIETFQAVERRESENKRIEANNKGFARQVARTGKKIDQLKVASAEKAFDARNQYIEARGELVASAQNIGTGASINDQIRAFGFKAGRAETLRQINLSNQIDSITDNLEDLHAQAVSNALQVTPAPFIGSGITPQPVPDTSLANIGAVLGAVAPVVGPIGRSIKSSQLASTAKNAPTTLSASSGLQIGGGIDP
jgi:hypothetical protein